MSYFFDTYAIIEVLDGSFAYRKYLKEPMRLTLLNLGELHYYLLKKDIEKHEIGVTYDKLIPLCIDISAEDIKEAMEFKFSHKKKAFSFVDSVGYVVSRREGLIFLTGDKEFEDICGVEYVK